MDNIVETLVEMGFSKERAELAMKRSGSQNVQDVMEWLLSHEEEIDSAPHDAPPAPEPAAATPNVEEQSTIEEPAQVAKSIRCDDCGKLFQTSDQVEFHAVKTKHENFSESTEEKKPLTEEEKKEQLAKIEAKLKQRRLEREAKEKEEALLREKNRIKSGKEMLEAKKRYEELEMKKIMEQKKREKEEERLAKQRVREQIEQDKLARKARQAGEVLPVQQPQPVLVKNPVKNYDQVKLQIRLTNGEVITQTFGAKEPLSAVRLYVEMNRSDSEDPFKLSTSYPRKVFADEDYDKPLETLGLAPSAVLIVSKN